MQIGHKVDETGLLLRDGGSFYLRRDAGGRFALDLRRTPIDEVEKRVRLVGTYVGGDLVDADTSAIDRMLNLNINVVMKNVHDVLPHMIARKTGDIIVTSSLAAHFPTPWEPVYAASKWAIDCFVQTVRRQVFKHGIRVGAISPGPVITALIADWPAEKLKEARESGSLLEASEVANVVLFMLTRPRGMTIRDVVMLPTNFDL